jgi:DNA polymerase-3 subunit alpha
VQSEKAGGQDSLFGGAHAEPEKFIVPQAASWPAAERLRREFEAVGFFLSGHPLDDYAHVMKKLRVEKWTDFARAVKQGASAARLAATVLDRSERRTKSGNKMGIVTLSDQSGQYEAIMFQEGLNQYRDLLEKGAAVLVSIQANVEGEDVRARITSVEPLAQAAHRVQQGLRVFMRDPAPLPSLQARLTQRGEGEVSLVLMLDKERGEVEVKLPGRFQISPQIAGAIKSIPGVVSVEHV